MALQWGFSNVQDSVLHTFTPNMLIAQITATKEYDKNSIGHNQGSLHTKHNEVTRKKQKEKDDLESWLHSVNKCKVLVNSSLKTITS